MAERRWPRHDIEQLVRGHAVLMCDAQAQPVPVPDWIASAAGQVLPLSVAELVESMDAGRRGELLAWLLDVLDAQGTCMALEVPGDIGDGWRNYRIDVVNLLHQDDVRGIVGAGVDLGPAEPPVAPVPSRYAGRHQSVNWFLARLDREGRMVELQGRYLELLGRDADELIGRHPVSYMHPDAIPDVVEVWAELSANPGATMSSERCLVRPDGVEVWAESTYLNRIDADGNGDILLLVYDITDRIRHEEELRRSNAEITALAEQFRMLADEVPAAVFRCTRIGEVRFHNRQWTDVFGTEGPVANVLDVVHPADRDAVATALAFTDPDQGDGRTSLEVRDVAGERTFTLTLRSAGKGDGDVPAVVGSLEDITDTVVLRRQAERDGVTGLLNRIAIEEVLEGLGGDAAAQAAVLFIDLDQFKAVNDTYGHEAGDVVLRAVADRLRHAVRPLDHVSRYGGDEFLIVCEGVDDDALDGLVGRIRIALAEPVPFDGGTWVPQASTGSARPRVGEGASGAVRRADLAMFDVKRRNRVPLAGPAEG